MKTAKPILSAEQKTELDKWFQEYLNCGEFLSDYLWQSKNTTATDTELTSLARDEYFKAKNIEPHYSTLESLSHYVRYLYHQSKFKVRIHITGYISPMSWRPRISTNSHTTQKITIPHIGKVTLDKAFEMTRLVILQQLSAGDYAIEQLSDISHTVKQASNRGEIATPAETVATVDDDSF
jgi:hypothetical protein